MRLGDLAAVTGGRLTGGNPRALVTRFVIDSRAVERGDYFVALKGVRHDGHVFVRDVLDKGAGGLVLSREIKDLPESVNCLVVPDTVDALQRIARDYRRRFDVRVVGITGSNGKTTTKEMTAQVLAAAGKTLLSTKGNMNSQIGLPLMLLELETRSTHAVLEMGASEKGNIARLSELASPDVGVITGIGAAHLEFFGSLENVLAAKWELMEALGPAGRAVLNADDALLMSRRKSLKCPLTTFGVSENADVRAEKIRFEPGAVFDLIMDGQRREIQLPVSGEFNVRNALAAAAVARGENISLDVVAAALAKFNPPPQRMEIQTTKDNVTYVIDAYNANPTSMKASLEGFNQAFPNRTKIVVLGSMLELGPAAEAEHANLGKLLAGLNMEKIYFIGPEGEWMKSGLAAAGGKTIVTISQNKEALRNELKKSLSPGVAVLFKASRGVRLEDVYQPLLEG